MPSISHGRFSDLIGMVYDCAVDPEHWPGTLTAIRDSTHLANAQLSALAIPTGEFLLQVNTGIEPGFIEAQEGYQNDVIDMWGGMESIAAYPTDRPVVLSQARPEQEYLNGRYYREWAKPQGLVDLVGMKIAADDRAVGTLAMGLHESAGAVSSDDLEMLTLLLPHIQRAVSISRLLDIKAIEARTFAATLNALSAGALLVGDDLEIVHANEAARRMLAARLPVTSERGRLVVPSDTAQRMLEQAVKAASRRESDIDLAGFGIPVRREAGPAVLHVLPLRYGQVRPRLAPKAAAVIFVVSAFAPRPTPDHALAALFDLTPMEAKVFALVAAGVSVAEAAQTLGIGQSTVKTHLHQVFQKTGSKRQSDLVRLAASLSL